MTPASGLCHCDLGRFDKQSNGRRTAVESKSDRNHGIKHRTGQGRSRRIETLRRSRHDIVTLDNQRALLVPVRGLTDGVHRDLNQSGLVTLTMELVQNISAGTDNLPASFGASVFQLWANTRASN